jgi:hypothetical protein
MHSWPRPLSQPKEETADLPPPAPRPVPPTRVLSATLARFRLRPRRPAPTPPDAQDPRLERARAVLADARMQMPGLLGVVERSDGPQTSSLESVAPPPQDQPPAVDDRSVTGTDNLARLDATLARIEEERRQLGAEVAALRLIVEELRETLVRLDERTSAGQAAISALPPVVVAKLEGPRTSISSDEGPPAVLPQPPDDRTGGLERGTCIEVRLLSAGAGDAIEKLKQALEAEPEVERVGLTPLPAEEALLHLELRSPQPNRVLASLLQRAAPTAKPLASDAPGTFLLRLRPS